MMQLFSPVPLPGRAVLPLSKRNSKCRVPGPERPRSSHLSNRVLSLRTNLSGGPSAVCRYLQEDNPHVRIGICKVQAVYRGKIDFRIQSVHCLGAAERYPGDVLVLLVRKSLLQLSHNSSPLLPGHPRNINRSGQESSAGYNKTSFFCTHKAWWFSRNTRTIVITSRVTNELPLELKFQCFPPKPRPPHTSTSWDGFGTILHSTAHQQLEGSTPSIFVSSGICVRIVEN